MRQRNEVDHQLAQAGDIPRHDFPSSPISLLRRLARAVSDGKGRTVRFDFSALFAYAAPIITTLERLQVPSHMGF
jgi:hypothetical protein